jgi:PilZ domain
LRKMAKEETDPRLHQRSNVYLGAVLSTDDGASPVRVRNLSVHGALLEGDDLPVEGTKVQLGRGRLSAAGTIAWQRGNQRGVRFDEPVEVGGWVRPTGHRGQQRVDAAIAAIRGARPSPDLLAIVGAVPDSQESLESLSEELALVCERIAATEDLPIDVAEQIMRLEVISNSIGRLARKGRSKT